MLVVVDIHWATGGKRRLPAGPSLGPLRFWVSSRLRHLAMRLAPAGGGFRTESIWAVENIEKRNEALFAGTSLVLTRRQSASEARHRGQAASYHEGFAWLQTGRRSGTHLS